MPDLSEAAKGVADAWDMWLYQHPHSTSDVIESAVRDAVLRWLNDHGEEILERAAFNALSEMNSR